jgi:hypothetical protein
MRKVRSKVEEAACVTSIVEFRERICSVFFPFKAVAYFLRIFRVIIKLSYKS